MNGQSPGAVNSETVTQESLLLAAAERIGRIREGRTGVHLHLSGLKAQNRQEGHLRIVIRMLEPMVNAYRGQMFLLGNSDIVLMLKDANLTDVENMVFKLRALFSKDPLTFDQTGADVDQFCTWYDLEGSGYSGFLEMAKELDAEAKQRSQAKREGSVELMPLTSKDLDQVLTALSGTDVSGFIRRQSSIVMSDRANAQVLFQEFFVALNDLQKAVGGEFNLFANRWLFQHLSLTLDERVLDALSRQVFTVEPPMYSLNLNLASVFSERFDRFIASKVGKARIAVEIQVLDVLIDSRGYFKARDKLVEAGCQVLIDGISALTLKFMDVTRFDADLYKLAWSPEAKEGVSLAGLDPEKMVLCRCDTEGAIQWGLDRGIDRFQGRFVDAMLAAYTMAHCDKASACTLKQCIDRHGVIAGPVRAECGNWVELDYAPVMRAGRRDGGPL